VVGGGLEEDRRKVGAQVKLYDAVEIGDLVAQGVAFFSVVLVRLLDCPGTSGKAETLVAV
jgi:hypothetical protein